LIVEKNPNLADRKISLVISGDSAVSDIFKKLSTYFSPQFSISQQALHIKEMLLTEIYLN
jgi:hypothetical protein